MLADGVQALAPAVLEIQLLAVLRHAGVCALLGKTNTVPTLQVGEVLGCMHEQRGISDLGEVGDPDAADAQHLLDGTRGIADLVLAPRQAFFRDRGYDLVATGQRGAGIMAVVDAKDVGGIAHLDSSSNDGTRMLSR